MPEIKLSNPLREVDAERLGIDVRKYATGETITVSKNAAKEIINAGYAQVDPEDVRAVHAVLKGESAATTSSMPSATSGQPEPAPEAAKADAEKAERPTRKAPAAAKAE